MSFEYLAILMGWLFVAIYIQKVARIRIYRTTKECILAVSLFFCLGVLWDTFAIWRGHWMFPPGNTMGITIGLMPLEEYLFMFIIPYAIIVIYKSLSSSMQRLS